MAAAAGRAVAADAVAARVDRKLGQVGGQVLPAVS